MKTYWRASGLSRLFVVSAALMPLWAGAQSISPAAATATPASSVEDVQVARAGEQTRGSNRGQREAELPRHAAK